MSRIYIILGTILLGLILGHEARCQATTHEDYYKWEVSIGAGYFCPAREGFREYYGSNAQYEMGAAYKISLALRVGADFSYTRLRKSEYPIKFTMLSFVPIVQFTFPSSGVVAPYLGGGIGYYRGKVNLQAQSAQGKLLQSGVGLKGYGGVRFGIWRRLFFAIEGTYFHTFLGDPYRGDFGNVGGFSGIVKSGMMF